MIVDPDSFTVRMSNHWVRIGNHLSEPLQNTWKDIAGTFNRRIYEQFNGQWDVLALPTGSGKSQGLALYCSMLPAEHHPGVLIVVPLKEQADTICEQINMLADARIALAHHADSKRSKSQLHQAPVLAITHAAYLAALSSDTENALDQVRINLFAHWIGGERRLTVIDEAIPMHRTYKTSLQNMSVLCGALRYLVQSEVRMNLQHIEALCNSISTWSEAGCTSERYLTKAELALLNSVSFEPVEDELQCISAEDIIFGNDDGIPGSEMKRQCAQTLRNLRGLVRVSNPWLSKRGKLVTLAAAEPILTEVTRGGVILDATARVDVRYELLEGSVRIYAPSQPIRDYSNVTLWTIRDQRVGKEYMTGHGWKSWPSLEADLSRQLGLDRSVLVCCHKDVQAKIERHNSKFAQTAYAHWGAITGKNNWQEFDTVVVLGLNYLNSMSTAETFVGLKGPTSDDWLQSPICRTYKKYMDVREALSTSHLAISLIQAVNRIRCRRTNNSSGGCEPAEIVMLAPKGAEGEKLIGMVRAEMPGLQVCEWSGQASTRRERTAPTKALVHDFLRNAPNGIYTNKEVMIKLDVSKATYDRVIAAYKNESSAESQELRKYGLRYMSRAGRGNLSGFIKEAAAAV